MPPTRPDRQRPTTVPAAPKQPPRPPNAWILYRSDKLRELASNQPPGPRRPQAEISKIISQMWSTEGPETKGHYEARAEEKKAEHAALYPDYKFAPMKKEDKAQLRKAQRLEKEELKQLERSRARKRKGKGRADDDDEDEAPSRPFVTAPASLPYPLSAHSTPTQGLQQPRPAQTWYPPSTYGPQHSQDQHPHPYPQHVNAHQQSHPSPPQPHQHPRRLPPPPLPAHLQSSGARTASGSAAFAAAGWSAPVDPEQTDAPFRVDAYRQVQDDDAEEDDLPAWKGEEDELGAEVEWHGPARRGAVWDEEQVPRQEQYQYQYESYPQDGYQQQEDPVSAWTHSSTPPPQPTQRRMSVQQPPSLTITLPATLNPTESDPYTFSLDFDMPMASYTADPDAQVRLSLASVNIGESSNAVGTGLLSGVGEYSVPGLNDLLEAPLPDIDVSFPEFMDGNDAEGQAGFDVLTADNEGWWQALMDVAFMGETSEQQQGYDVAGPSGQHDEQQADPSSPDHAFKGSDGGVMLAPRRESASQEVLVGQLGLDSSVPASNSRAASGSRVRPPPVHAHTMPVATIQHGLPSPEPFGPQETFEGRTGGRSRAGSSAYPPVQTYQEQPYGQYSQQSYQEQAYAPQEAQAQDQAYVHPSPFAQIASRGAPQTARRVGASWQHQSAPVRKAPTGRPQPRGGFPSPSGAGGFPSPSGGVPRAVIPPPPTQPFFNTRKGKEDVKPAVKDSEAFDFSGWGSQYAVPPTPAEDTVRRGCVGAITN